MSRLTVLTAALIAALGLLPPQPPPASAGTDPILFGAYVGPGPGQTVPQAVTAYEQLLGRPLAAVRVYDLWNQPFPDASTTWLRDTGHTLLVSVKAKRLDKTIVTWRSIADAAPGSARYQEIAGWADAVKAFGAPLYFTFNHEPEAATNSKNGTAQDFIGAWRKVITVFRDRGVTNATFLWIMTDYSFWVQDGRSAPLWYPGDAYVDAIGADAYNWYHCRPGIANTWKSLQSIVEPLRQFGLQHPGKALFLPEFASVEDANQSGRKASWVRDAEALFQQPGWEAFRGILYYDAHDQNNASCLWDVDSSASSLAAVQALGADPYYSGTAGGQPPPPPPPDPPVFADGFESGSMGAWAFATNIAVQSSVVAKGTYAARAVAQGKGAYAYASLGQSYSDIRAWTRLDVVSQGDNYVNVMKLQGSTGSPIVTAALTPGAVLLLRNDQTGVTTASSTTVTRGVWHDLGVHLTVAGSASSVTVTLDGVVVPGLSFTLSLGTTTVGRIMLGDSTTGQTFDVAMDDIAVATTDLPR